MRHALETLCFLLISASCAAQDLKICTLLGCNSGLRIELVGMPNNPPVGHYRVEARINGSLVACSVAVTKDTEALSSCQSSSGAPWVELSLQASNQYIDVRGAAPRHVHVTMFYESRMVGEARISPESYKVLEPNGHECEPICLLAGPYSMPLTGMPVES